MLKTASSHWEILGWGERECEDGKEVELGQERWVVTWFAPSLFTPAGLDIYSSEKGGMSEKTLRDIMAALENLEAKEMVELVKDMKEIKIDY